MKILSGFLLILSLATQFSCGVWTNFQLKRNRNLWQESNIKNYRMTIAIDKTGHATPNGKFVITVREGKTESIKRADNLEIVGDTVKFGSYDSLDDIFDFIENREKDGGVWDRKEIEYDSKLGYPKRVNIDIARVNDEELFFEVLQFESLQ